MPPNEHNGGLFFFFFFQEETRPASQEAFCQRNKSMDRQRLRARQIERGADLPVSAITSTKEQEERHWAKWPLLFLLVLAFLWPFISSALQNVIFQRRQCRSCLTRCRLHFSDHYLLWRSIHLPLSLSLLFVSPSAIID